MPARSALKQMIPALILISAALLCCTPRGGGESTAGFPVLSGPYLGQEPPGAEPELFAPGIVTTGIYTRDIAMTPDGKEIYFCVALGQHTYTAICFTREVEGRWTKPEVVPFGSDPAYLDFEPCISPDGGRLYFLSNRPDAAKGEMRGDHDIWAADRTEGGWGEPYNLGPPVNTEAGEFFPSVTRDGTLYFTRNEGRASANAIYRSRPAEGRYTEPERLGSAVNSAPSQFNAFIAPDESYIIVCAAGREDSRGGTDYYISYRSENDTWTGPVNLGDKINTQGSPEFSPYVSPDGRYFFFMSSRTAPEKDFPGGRLTFDLMKKMHNEPRNGSSDIYWMDAGFIEELRPL